MNRVLLEVAEQSRDMKMKMICLQKEKEREEMDVSGQVCCMYLIETVRIYDLECRSRYSSPERCFLPYTLYMLQNKDYLYFILFLECVK